MWGSLQLAPITITEFTKITNKITDITTIKIILTLQDWAFLLIKDTPPQKTLNGINYHVLITFLDGKVILDG